MNLQERKRVLLRLGMFMLSDAEEWQAAKEKAGAYNHWFIPEFIDLAVMQIAHSYLSEGALSEVIERYKIEEENPAPKKVGIVMAGNIPLVGFHDLFCVFLTGHFAYNKLSSKDDILPKVLIKKMQEWDHRTEAYFVVSELLRGCDAYIATGSNNSAGYFDYYFRKYPHIIRKNRTSAAILTGRESTEELISLADDVYQYFGLGCRNVTKLYVPRDYNFEALISAFKKYNYLSSHKKYKNNYDYNLAIHLLNHTYYMSTESLLVIEDTSPFSPISQLNYEYYDDPGVLKNLLKGDERIQCVVEQAGLPFGQAQCPGVFDYADGVDTIAFLQGLK